MTGLLVNARSMCRSSPSSSELPQSIESLITTRSGDIIIWVGMQRGSLATRILGFGGLININLSRVPITQQSRYMLCHVEGTDHKDFTTPTA